MNRYIIAAFSQLRMLSKAIESFDRPLLVHATLEIGTLVVPSIVPLVRTQFTTWINTRCLDKPFIHYIVGWSDIFFIFCFFLNEKEEI